MRPVNVLPCPADFRQTCLFPSAAIPHTKDINPKPMPGPVKANTNSIPSTTCPTQRKDCSLIDWAPATNQSTHRLNHHPVLSNPASVTRPQHLFNTSIAPLPSHIPTHHHLGTHCYHPHQKHHPTPTLQNTAHKPSHHQISLL